MCSTQLGHARLIFLWLAKEQHISECYRRQLQKATLNIEIESPTTIPSLKIAKTGLITRLKSESYSYGGCSCSCIDSNHTYMHDPRAAREQENGMVVGMFLYCVSWVASMQLYAAVHSRRRRVFCVKKSG